MKSTTTITTTALITQLLTRGGSLSLPCKYNSRIALNTLRRLTTNHNIQSSQQTITIITTTTRSYYSTLTRKSNLITFRSHTSLPTKHTHSRHFGFSKFLGSIINDPAILEEKTHTEKKVLRFSPDKVFQVVSSVDQYSSFLPWCKKSVILKRNKDSLEATLAVGLSYVQEEYTSNVSLETNKKVVVEVPPSNLFEHLTTVWEFEKGPTPDSCLVNFSLSFKLKQSLHAKILDSMFTSAVESMVKAFEERCHQVYGDPININV